MLTPALAECMDTNNDYKSVTIAVHCFCHHQVILFRPYTYQLTDITFSTTEIVVRLCYLVF